MLGELDKRCAGTRSGVSLHSAKQKFAKQRAARDCGQKRGGASKVCNSSAVGRGVRGLGAGDRSSRSGVRRSSRSGVRGLGADDKSEHSGVMRSRDGAADDATLGLASETDAQHAARHPIFRRACARCVYGASRGILERSYGSYKHGSGDRVLRTIWLAPRPARLGGDWAVGCTFCATLRQKRADALDACRREGRLRPQRRRGPRDANTAWARFEIRSPDQIAARGVRQHAETQQHRVAVKAFFAPDDAITVAESSAAEADAELFKGGVPQVADWLRAWRSCRTPQSFAAAEANGCTDNFIKGSRVPGTSRKAFRSMVETMALVLRARKRNVLASAEAISLVLDDRGAFRVVSFRCSLAPASDAQDSGNAQDPGLGAQGSGAAPCVATGCLAVLRRGGNFSEKSLADCDEDYSREMAQSIVRAIEQIAQCPRSGERDAALVDRICQRVRVGVSDGAAAAQKCLKFLASGSMPNMLWVGRDRAHTFRIATTGPMLREKTFKAWWADTFGDRHALVPDIQNSEEWLAKLALCQKQVLRSDGVQGCDVNAVARTLSFAKQRFDSLAGPQFTFCVILVSIAMLLAYQASDLRQKSETRARARRRLLQMPGQVVTAGLSATYGDEAIRFVRAFDVAHHDPAKTYSCGHSFLERMRVLFCEGRVLQEQECDSDTPLGIAFKAARTAPPLYYDNGKVLNLFQKPSPAAAQEIADGITAITSCMTERVKVELSTGDLGVLFTAFDLVRWRDAQRDARERADRTKLLLLGRHAAEMFRGWGFDRHVGVRELTKLALRLCVDVDTREPKDNRVVWEQVLRPGFLSAGETIETLGAMLHIYLAATDSTCGVERDLGALTRVLKQHAGKWDEEGATISFCTEVLLDGPISEEGLGCRPGEDAHESQLEATDFTRECARLWVDMRGRRFRVYKTGGRPCGKQRERPMKGTWAAAKRRAKDALDKLVADGPRSADAPTMLGLPRSRLLRAATDKNPARKGKLLKKFDKTTQQKARAQKKLQMVRRCAGGNPYAFAGLNPNEKLRRGNVFTRGPEPIPELLRGPGGRIVVVDCCSEPIEQRDGYDVRRLMVGSTPRLQLFVGAGVVLTEQTWLVDGQALINDRALAAFCAAMGLGKPVLGRSHWVHCRPGGPPSASLVRYRASVREIAQTLAISVSFKQRYPLFSSVLEQCAAVAGSKWKVSVQDLAPNGVTPITCREDARSFIIKIRRIVQRGRGMLGGRHFSVEKNAPMYDVAE